jgi:cell division protein ZapB
LTCRDASHYIPPMEDELTALEDKIKRLLTLCQRMQRENQELRQQLAGALAEKRQLAEKMSAARGRLETLIARIPEEQQ